MNLSTVMITFCGGAFFAMVIRMVFFRLIAEIVPSDTRSLAALFLNLVVGAVVALLVGMIMSQPERNTNLTSGIMIGISTTLVAWPLWIAKTGSAPWIYLGIHLVVATLFAVHGTMNFRALADIASLAPPWRGRSRRIDRAFCFLKNHAIAPLCHPGESRDPGSRNLRM